MSLFEKLLDKLFQTIARLQHRDFYIGTDGRTRAARNIKEGETVTMTLEQYTQVTTTDRDEDA